MNRMYCPDCNSIISENQKFCQECGKKLSNSTKNICKNCGELNSPDSNYCSGCGSKLSKRKNKPIQTTVDSSESIKNNNQTLILTSSVLIFFIVIVFLIRDFYQHKTNQVTTAQFKTTQLEPEVAYIATQFKCACGQCDDPNLAVCSCPTALEEHNFIRSLLKQGKNADKIISLVQEKYGYYIGTASGNLSDELAVEMNNLKSSVPSGSSNFEYIVSRFSCPCGQCGMPELAECECNHPSGAQQVKQEIKNYLNQNMSSDEIIALIEKKYGHRIR